MKEGMYWGWEDGKVKLEHVWNAVTVNSVYMQEMSLTRSKLSFSLATKYAFMLSTALLLSLFS